jgi:hypothetical protein
MDGDSAGGVPTTQQLQRLRGDDSMPHAWLNVWGQLIAQLQQTLRCIMHSLHMLCRNRQLT